MDLSTIRERERSRRVSWGATIAENWGLGVRGWGLVRRGRENTDSSVRHAHEEKPAMLQTCAQRTLPRGWRLVSSSPPSLKSQVSSLKGFTLLEVLVAMAVLAVALVSLLGLYNRSLLLTIRAQRLSAATLLVQEMLTRTQLEGMDAMRMTAGDFADLHPGQYPEFRWYRAVRPTALEGLWELRVGVSWGEREDETCELTLFTPLEGS